MFLKRIELNGFKSFPNKKELIINRGITGVVGPNGSGKSNIADALRWVLGEQSSKNLRGQVMQDVIFNGTQARGQKGYCEVGLVFDNTDGRIDLDYSEISVKRKMYRSGESEFYINGTGCRLRDILDLFRDTGIGKEGYSIIGQGKIDEILSSKPTQRRKVFEEAAGIMKYRARKEEAERNLQKTNENITRLDDIILELETQLEPLEQQMQEAKSYLSLRDRLKELEVNLYLYQHDRSDERIRKLDEQIGELEQEFADAEREVEALNKQAAEIKQQNAQLQGEIEQHNARLAEYARAQEQQKGAMSLIEERQRNNRSMQEENERKIRSHSAAIEENARRLDEIAVELEGYNAEIDRGYEQIQKLRGTLAEGEREEGEPLGAFIERLDECREALQGVDVRRSEVQIKLEMLANQKLDAQTRIAELGQIAFQLEEDTGKLEAALVQQEGEIADHRRQFNGIAANLQRNQQQKMEASIHLTQAQKALNEQESQFALLREMKEEHEGYFDSVKSLLRDAGERPELREKIQGVLAEAISVPREYETPLEVILGNALQNIVVKTDEDAKALIDFLRARSLGRVTFLPTKSLQVRYLEESERGLLSMKGVHCVASEAVTCGDDIRPAVDFLLARTVIVEDMDCAIKVMRRAGYAFRVVTMQGDIMRPGGVITGGSLKSAKTGLLARKRRTEELEASIRTNTKAVNALKAKDEEYDAAIAAAKKDRQAILEAIQAGEVSLAEQRQRLDAAKRQQEERSEALRGATEGAKNMEEEEASLRTALGELEQEAEDCKARHEKAARQLAEKQKAAQEKLDQTMETKDALSALELEQTQLKNKKEMLLAESQRLRDADLQTGEAVKTLGEQNEAAQKEQDALTAQKERINRELDDMLVEIKNADVMSRDQLELRDTLAQQTEELEGKREAIGVRKNELIESKYRLIANKEKTEGAKANMLSRLWDDYGLTYANAEQLKTEFAYQSATREIDGIKEQMREMGAVNPNAIEDYARVSERYGDLTTQRADLVQAGEDLQVVIDSLLSKMKDSFRKKFTMINENFTRVFRELFGGGTAFLELLDDGDIMECGIEITAEPPGKKLQSLTLLSGGEKALTAVALLFAMLDINPSPVCLLDEIDAQLDDANVIRLSEYLQKISDELQFIVITHRKPTMAVCDTLYGIAMQEKGISDIVSVKLS